MLSSDRLLITDDLSGGSVAGNINASLSVIGRLLIMMRVSAVPAISGLLSVVGIHLLSVVHITLLPIGIDTGIHLRMDPVRRTVGYIMLTLMHVDSRKDDRCQDRTE